MSVVAEEDQRCGFEIKIRFFVCRAELHAYRGTVARASAVTVRLSAGEGAPSGCGAGGRQSQQRERSQRSIDIVRLR